MFFQQVYDDSLAQASYMVGCQVVGEAIVIDPKRDIDTYLDIAKRNNLTITKIVETHIHADFLSGSRELAALTNAEIYLSDEGGEDWQYNFPHVGLVDADKIKLGNLTFEVIHTPGHTPESISLLLTDHPASDVPVMLFTGDFVFVGDVGRPDLLEKAAGIIGTKEKGALDMFQSLSDFRRIPEFVQMWPGHGAGSACGKALGAVPSSTVGYELIRNWALQIADQSRFVEQLLDGQPDPPKYFAEMKRRNKEDRPLLTNVPNIPKLSRAQLVDLPTDQTQIVDTRSKFHYANGHIEGTLNIQMNKSFATWCGWMLNYDQPIVLIVEPDFREEATRRLMRIGMDNLIGYVDPLELDNGAMESTRQVNIDEVEDLRNEGFQILDVRNKREYEDGHIQEAKNIFVGELEERFRELDPSKPILIYCQSGDRAAIASSFLKKQGFQNIAVYFGGNKEWLELGKPVELA